MKTLTLTALLLLPVAAIASETNEKKDTASETKTYDHKKFCYYEDKEFSEGARHFQVDEVKTCVRDSEGILVWRTLK